MSINNGICIAAIKVTKERLLEERTIIDEKIKALDIVLEMFDEGEQVKNPEKESRLKKQRAGYGTLTPEEKKRRKKVSMDKWLAKKKKENTRETDKKIDYDDMA